MMDSDVIVINETLSLPQTELQFRFSTGGGPGGQHVNKTATRATLLFDVANSPSLDEEMRVRLLDRLASRIDGRGLLHIDVHESRSQWQNRAAAVDRFRDLVADALVEHAERRPTRPSRRARQARLEDKRRRSAIKQERRRRWDH